MSSIEEEITQSEMKTPLQTSTEVLPEKKGFGIDLSILKTPTGDGEIEDYINHVLNFNNSKGMARIIRGLTGFIGNMNFAFVDIIVGVLDLMSKKVKPIEPINHV